MKKQHSPVKAVSGSFAPLCTFQNLLVCPQCHLSLIQTLHTLHCHKCKTDYFFKKSVPLFVSSEEMKRSQVAHYIPPKRSAFIMKMKRILRPFKPPHHSLYFADLSPTTKPSAELASFAAIVSQTFPQATMVNIGSLAEKVLSPAAEEKIGQKTLQILNLDISFYEGVHIVADAHALPFSDQSLEAVILKNVFEHLRDPVKVRDELQRVLKKDGYVYARIPFLVPFHGAPEDYQRYTYYGIRELFKDFTIIEEKIAVGPSSALSWILQEYCALLFSFGNDQIYRFNKKLFAYILFGVKYLDIFFRNNKNAHQLASGFTLIARRK